MPKPHRLLLLLALSAAQAAAQAATPAQPPRILEASPSAPEVGRFDLFELTLRLDALFANPYDPDDIEVVADFTDPDGQTRTLAGFIYQDYERTLEAGKKPSVPPPAGQPPDKGKEKLTPKGDRVWKIRYAPLTLGPHRYTIRVRTRGGSAQTQPATFTAVPSRSPGFVRVSPRNPHYFAFTDATPFFPIGHNVCWADSQLMTYDYDRYFRKMAANHENFTRIWMCSWSLELEGDRLDDYRLDNAWRLDHILRFAHTYGIYAKLCLDNFYDFTQKRHGPYWQAHGGPCREPRDFFTLPAARAHYLRRLRYIAARWGYSTDLMAWEFWNEMDYAPSERGRVLSRKEPYMLAWTADMAAALRRLDPFAHLVTNSLAAYTDWPEFWSLPALDFAQPHAYIYEDWEPTPKQYDSADLVIDIAQDFEQYRKPYFIAELGFQPTGDTNRLNRLDTQGVHLHNALWASVLTGAAAAPMLWWWDNYVDTNDLYFHYRALGEFLAGVDWTAHSWQPIQAPPEGPTPPEGSTPPEGFKPSGGYSAASSPHPPEGPTPPEGSKPSGAKATSAYPPEGQKPSGGEIEDGRPPLRILGLHTADHALLWAHDRRNSWHRRLLQKQPPRLLDPFAVRIGGLDPGRYRLDWFDTYSGGIITTTEADSDARGLPLQLPHLVKAPDVACKVTPLPASR